MTDDLVFLKAAGWLVVGYWLLRGWQWHKARRSTDDPRGRIEHR